ncbi:MAG: hypothetical protein P4L40_24925 [Terracidiphilus sp.]|nr:hypothetical protein [Terracidiphilus sp.]
MCVNVSCVAVCLCVSVWAVVRPGCCVAVWIWVRLWPFAAVSAL